MSIKRPEGGSSSLDTSMRRAWAVWIGPFVGAWVGTSTGCRGGREGWRVEGRGRAAYPTSKAKKLKKG